MHRSGPVSRGIPTSAEALARSEAAELAELRAQYNAGELTMQQAQEQLMAMVLHRTHDFPEHMQRDLREHLEAALATDPYLRSVRGESDENK